MVIYLLELLPLSKLDLTYRAFSGCSFWYQIHALERVIYFHGELGHTFMANH